MRLLPGKVLAVCSVIAGVLAPGALQAAVLFTEDFSAAPIGRGWSVHGDENLFVWNSTNQNLQVTWNSAQTNSFFHRSLGTVLTAEDDFSFGFDLKLDDFAIGVSPTKPGTFEIAIGLLNLSQATQTNFFRGAGVNGTYGPRNLVEFNFFPAWDFFLPTINQVIVSTNNGWLYNDDNLMDLTPGEVYQVRLNYSSATRTLTTVVSNGAALYGEFQTIVVPPNFDFRVTALAVSSYSDAIQPFPPGSILAHGSVDNFRLTVPDAPVQNLAGGFVGPSWQLQFVSRTNWVYRWERTTNFVQWHISPTSTLGSGNQMTLTDATPPLGGAFYRVNASRP